MDRQGVPVKLFTTNRWVTADNWYAASDVKVMLDRFEIDLAHPSWPVNVWITAMLRLFRPQILELIDGRDRAVADWRASHPDVDVFEDRDLEITCYMDIDVEAQVRAVSGALLKRK